MRGGRHRVQNIGGDALVVILRGREGRSRRQGVLRAAETHSAAGCVGALQTDRAARWQNDGSVVMWGGRHWVQNIGGDALVVILRGREGRSRRQGVLRAAETRSAAGCVGALQTDRAARWQNDGSVVMWGGRHWVQNIGGDALVVILRGREGRG